MFSYMWNPAYYLKDESQCHSNQNAPENIQYSQINSSLDLSKSTNSLYFDSPSSNRYSHIQQDNTSKIESDSSYYSPNYQNSYPKFQNDSQLDNSGLVYSSSPAFKQQQQNYNSNQLYAANHFYQSTFNYHGYSPAYTPAYKENVQFCRNYQETSTSNNSSTNNNFYHTQMSSAPISHNSSLSSPESIRGSFNFNQTSPIIANQQHKPIINRSANVEKLTVNNNSSNIVTSGPKQIENPKSNKNVKVKMQDSNIWKKFNQAGTEMIVTKSGR